MTHRASQWVPLGLVCVLWVVGCAVASNRPHLTIEAESHNWWAHSVYLYCEGAQVAALKGLEINAHRSRRVYRPCREAVVVILGLGGRAYRSPVTLVEAGDTLAVTAGATLNLSTVFVR